MIIALVHVDDYVNNNVASVYGLLYRRTSRNR